MEPRTPRWETYEPLTSEEIRRTQSELSHLELSPLMVQLLANRGLRKRGDIEHFLVPPDIPNHPDPLLMVGMPQAVDRICAAISKKEKIVVFGDFDADGVTSTALLTIALRHFGADVQPYIPNRVKEGYGLNLEALRAIFDDGKGATLVITVDCGISNHEEALEALAWGLDLIVTDHHILPAELPKVICINPKQHVDGCEDFECLAGVGVAYQLVRALVKRLGKPPGLRNTDLLGLVAIGTVADMAPMRGANRSLVQRGLAAIPQHSLPGLKTMLKFAHVEIGAINTEAIGFAIGPRLNAAGRMDDARTAYRLLMTDNEWEAKELAQKLEADNRRRRALMQSITDQARAMAGKLDDSEFILLYGPQWTSDSGNPLGVVGLVAGKLVEEFGRPALVLAPGLIDGEYRGSARSTSDFDIHEALLQAKSLLVHFGGHRAAAGLTVKNEQIPALRESLQEFARLQVKDGKRQIQPVIQADCELRMEQITFQALSELNRLAPFGTDNPSPLFMAKNVLVVEASHLADGSHLKMLLADSIGIPSVPIEAIAWRRGDMLAAIKQHQHVDLLFTFERREWKGDVHLQIKVRDMRLSGQ